jgi:hypothetical protein
MTIERPMFPPREGKSALRVVGGVDFAPAGETEVLPARGLRKRRGPYKDHKPIEYHDGLPVIDPAGEEDKIFRSISNHRHAATHYDRCVDIMQEAEGKASSNEYSHLQHNTKNAFDDMMLWARAVIVGRPTTRRGLIHQARYLASQFNDFEGCEGGCMYLPDSIDEQRWPKKFLQSLAAGLRKMAGELDAPKEGGEA